MGRSPEPPVDPHTFGDPVALETKWTVLEHGGASFGTRRLEVISPARLELRATRAWYGMGLAFVVTGLLMGGGLAWSFLGREDSRGGLACPVLFVALFLVVGTLIVWAGRVPQVFDKSVGAYWIGRRVPTRPGLPGAGSLDAGADGFDGVRLDGIHALQLLRERCTSGTGTRRTTYYSYELNLVFRNGGRMNVIDHGNLPLLRRDASTLADFLGKPVWDATDADADADASPQASPQR